MREVKKQYEGLGPDISLVLAYVASQYIFTLFTGRIC